MVICEKGTSEMTPQAAERRHGAYGQGGPIFLPARRLSPLAQELLSPDGGVTAYDELWYEGCPRS